jgi:type II secretory pathway component PulM
VRVLKDHNGRNGRNGRSSAGLAAVVAAVGLGPLALPVAQAQPGAIPGGESDATGDEGELDLERIIAGVVDLLFALADGASEKVFDFLETVELFDFENEIDRLVGDPRSLNDSTAYKLSLLPFHIRFPIYQQLVRQMTRQDELRSRRIHTVTPDAVNVIALRISTLADDDVRDEVRASLLKHFSAREVVDLGFYLLAQQRFFPDTEEGWVNLKRSIADAGPVVAASALAAGAAFDVASLSRSGTIKRLFDQRLRLGWYAGVRKLGFRFRPQLRAGVTGHMPGFELALGLAQKIRPTTLDPARTIELAARESWINRLVRPSGWDAFAEGAFRYVLQEPTGYQGERMSGRAGFFARRDEIPGYKEYGLRFSAETESDFTEQVRFAIGVGIEHAPTGIATMIQSSRSAHPRAPLTLIDTSGGLFVAGTVEAPTQLFVDSMMTRARLVSDEWEVIHGLDQRRTQMEQKLRLFGTPGFNVATARSTLASIDRTMREREARFGAMGDRLADYLESRRVAYSIKHWSPREGDLHGPLDPQVLLSARTQLFLRLQELSGDLERSADRLQELRARHENVQENMRNVAQLNASSPALAGYALELSTLEKRLERESTRASACLDAYLRDRESARRIKAASPRALAAADPDPLPTKVMRRVMVLRGLSLH